MDTNAGGEQEGPLLDDYDDAESSLKSPSTLPTYSIEKPYIQIHSLDLEVSSPQALRSVHFSRGRDITKCLQGLLTALLPSFLQRSYDYKTRLHPTSWLDGLRGVAALIVFIYHFLLSWFPALDSGYASTPDSYYFLQLPFFRIIYSGRGMVSVFFVISGYVLSYSVIKKIRAGNFLAVLDTLASSVFRRWIRLFLPVLAWTFISMLIVRMDWYIGTGPIRYETVWKQLGNWWYEFVGISNPTRGMNGEDMYNNLYSSQLWTIPREMRGSMVTYLVLLCLAKTRQGVRITCMAFFSWYMLWIEQWDLYLFLIGMLLAEIDLLRSELFTDEDSTALLKFLPTSIHAYARAIMHTFTAALMLLAIHLLTFPDENPESTPGYAFMITFTPSTYSTRTLSQRYWLAHGALLLMLAISLSPSVYKTSHSPLFQRPFTTRFAQYLGNISFGLYITHFSLLYVVDARLLIYSKEKSLAEYLGGFMVAVIVVSLLAFWIADLFWRGVDKRSVVLAKWVAGKCFIV